MTDQPLFKFYGTDSDSEMLSHVQELLYMILVSVTEPAYGALLRRDFERAHMGEVKAE